METKWINDKSIDTSYTTGDYNNNTNDKNSNNNDTINKTGDNNNTNDNYIILLYTQKH